MFQFVPFQKTGDFELVKELLPAMEQEFQFWMERRTVSVDKDLVLARYSSSVDSPRPESYSEDYDHAEEYFESQSDRNKFYNNMAAAAESGWDFSSKWYL